MRDSIQTRDDLASPKRGGVAYRIIRTTEVDAYEVSGAPRATVLSRAELLAAPPGDKAHKRLKAARPGSPRPGMPAPDSIRSVVPFTSPSGRRYRVLKTDERDAYDAEPDPMPVKGKPPP